jgi:hypothetical protein
MGATKTASTFLQKCLRLNEQTLRLHGVYLPQAGRRESSVNVNHHNLAWEFLGDRRFKIENGDWNALQAELSGVDGETVLLSSEAFARLAGTRRTGAAFVRRLTGLSDDVTLVYVVRDPLSRINSMYTQTVKTFANPESFELYARKSVKSGFYDLERSFRSLYRGTEVTFVAPRFDDFVKRGPLESVLDVMGVEIAPELVTIPKDIPNVSPGPLAVEAIRMLNAHLRVLDPHFMRRDTAVNKMSELSQRRAKELGWNDTKFWGWPPELAQWAAAKLMPANERFAQAVWGEPWPLEMPVDKNKTSVPLIDLSGKMRHRVDKYVDQMIKRYLRLRRHERNAAEGEVALEPVEHDDALLDALDDDETE